MAQSMSLFIIYFTLIFMSYNSMLAKAEANQNLVAINCSFDSFASSKTYKINLGQLFDSIKELAERVASIDGSLHKFQTSSLGGGVKYFGTNVISFTTNNQRHNTNLYEMVRCMPNLSVQECSDCLVSMINKLFEGCKGRLGGRAATSNCFIRYETYPFYNISSTMESSLSPLIEALSMESNSKISKHPLAKISLKVIIAITVPTAILLGIATFSIGHFSWKAKMNYKRFPMCDDDFDTVQSLQYTLDELKEATQNFSDDNKIGLGGFGCVYKGILQDGQEIAVKKLFRSNSQVEQEFKNEVEVVAKLQHRNLVKLLGFCLAEGEKLLVFEYVPNTSLDKLLFDKEVQDRLDWLTRFKIIAGIARGLLYLHDESRHRIVHRDLKPSNILLDEKLNPKIADFGMARFFGIKESNKAIRNGQGTLIRSANDPTHQSTRGGGGTFGYMAPESAQKGQFSEKTDVYSYGVMMLEIISGKRNTHFYLSGLAEDLLSYSWIQWKQGTPLALVDEALISENVISNEEMKEQVRMCIHMSLLCIQKDPKMRPSMRMIVHVYSNFETEFKKWVGRKL